ncbi:LacI family DNA-binding transcriptional regulator [Vallitalea okinawensis]|uniref:LacI family DNA-binding transcriptional regulator n=1 Tax=Vallitalea okinawensis TaxID=2078660 RepID=UPI0014790E16|nr:LacI family DNA-binding transcriptional regulator [Vallitalea okinawensis]
MKKRVTSTDVAKEAGVSRATVSYILNDVKGISIKEETKKKVLKAANKLGYHPDSMAQALKTNKSMAIGVVSKRKISEQRFIHVLSGIKDELSKHKYSITLCSEEVDARGMPEYYSFYKSKKIDGIIFLSYQEGIDREELKIVTQMIQKEQIPTVFADYHMYDPSINCIDINYYHGAYIATQHVIEKGYNNLILLLPHVVSEQEKQRLKGVKKAVDDAKNTLLEIVRIHADVCTECEKIFDSIKQSNQRTAIIGAWHKFAFETLYETNKNKILVPEDVAVISLAGSSFASYSYPRLTTCDLPLYELGKKSAMTLLETLTEPSTMPVNMSLPCSLTERDSC